MDKDVRERCGNGKRALEQNEWIRAVQASEEIKDGKFTERLCRIELGETRERE